MFFRSKFFKSVNLGAPLVQNKNGDEFVSWFDFDVFSLSFNRGLFNNSKNFMSSFFDNEDNLLFFLEQKSILNKRLKQIFSSSETLIFNSNNFAVLATVLTIRQHFKNFVFISDDLISPYVKFGLDMPNCSQRTYKNNDMDTLERILMSYDNNVSKFVFLDSICFFSGKANSIGSVSDLCKKYNATFVLDESLSLGCSDLFDSEEKMKKNNNVDISICRFDFSVNNVGSCVSFSESYANIFDSSVVLNYGLENMSVFNMNAIYNALDFFDARPDLKDKRRFAFTNCITALKRIGLTLDSYNGLFFYIPISDIARLTSVYERLLNDYKIVVDVIAPPFVSSGLQGIRIVPCVNHTIDMVENLVSALKVVLRS